MATLIGFASPDTGDTAELSTINGSITLDNTVTINSNYSYKLDNLSAGGPWFTAVIPGTSGATRACYVPFRFTVDSAPAANTELECLNFYNSGSIGSMQVQLCLVVKTDGTTFLRCLERHTSTAMAQFGSDVAITAAAWHTLEVKAVCSASVGSIDVRLDNVSVASTTGINTGATNAINTIEVDNYYNSGTVTANTVHMWFGAVAMGDDWLYGTNGFAVKAVQGTAGTPTYDAWTKTGAATAAGVWSTTPFSATANAAATAASQAQTMLAAPTSGAIGAGTIMGRRMGAVAKEIGSGSVRVYSLRTRYNGADTDVVVALTATDAYYATPLVTSAMTTTLLDAMEIGGVRGISTGKMPQIEDAWLFVAYQLPNLTPPVGKVVRIAQAVNRAGSY